VALGGPGYANTEMLCEWHLLQDELSSSVPRCEGGNTVRFFDDMDLSDQRRLNSLHQSIHDLNTAQQRLRQELDEERLRRTQYVA